MLRLRRLSAGAQRASTTRCLAQPQLLRQAAPRHPGMSLAHRHPTLLQRRDSTGMAAVLFGISGSALVAQYVIHHGTVWWNSPRAPRRYKGGFEQEMTRREAALILGVRESADKKVAMERCVRAAAMSLHPSHVVWATAPPRASPPASTLVSRVCTPRTSTARRRLPLAGGCLLMGDAGAGIRR
jgi:hypothetical protein